MQETSKRVKYLYDLQDAGYDSKIIREFSTKLGHRPIIDINPRNSKKTKSKIELIKHENKIYYQGATKVASVLAFGILSICIHQSLKLIT